MINKRFQSHRMNSLCANNVANEKENLINIGSETNKIKMKAVNGFNWRNKQGNITIL